MANIKILLADSDEKYLMPLERKFIDGLEDKVDLIVITDTDYIKQYFATPQKLDILVIHEDMYDSELEKHNISNIFILTENDNKNSGDSDTKQIYKYTSVKEIYNEVINHSSTRTVPLNTVEETKILMVYSPIGGIGKTTVSALLCQALADYHKRVLFVGIDSLQTFGCIIDDLPYMESGTEKAMIEKSDYIYETMKSKIITQRYDILPPFYLSLPSLNIKGDDFIHLLNTIKKTRDYDYIILDGTSDFTEDLSRFMGIANHTIIIAGQEKNAVFKLNCLLRNIDCSDNERFVFVCNKYRSDRENHLSSESSKNLCNISEYIDYWHDKAESGSNYSLGNRSIQKLALMFI